MLHSKAIRAIGIDHLRQTIRVNKNTRSRGNLVKVFHLSVAIFKNAKEESRNENRRKEGTHSSIVREGMR